MDKMLFSESKLLVLARRFRSMCVWAIFLFAFAWFTLFTMQHVPQYSVAILSVAIAASYFLSSHGAKWLRPHRGKWIDAADRAVRRILSVDPDRVFSEAMGWIPEASVEIWFLNPPRILSLQSGTLLSARATSSPLELIHAACKQKGRTLRLEELEKGEIRLPELRPLVRMMRAYPASLALVLDGRDGPEGLLMIPPRKEGVFHDEEIEAFRRLADALGLVCGLQSMVARSFEREQNAERRGGEAESKYEEIATSLATQIEIQKRLVEYIAAPATVGPYSPLGRMTYTSLQDLVRNRQGGLLEVPHGADPIALLAYVHRNTLSSDAPFVVVNGVDYWQKPEKGEEERSPVALASGGFLVLCDGALLPLALQKKWGEELRKSAGQLAWICTLSAPVEQWIRSEKMHAALISLFRQPLEPIRMAPLGERSEEIRPLLIDRLARAGLRRRGVPVGIELMACAHLAEHPIWEDERALDAWVEQLLHIVLEDCIRISHLERKVCFSAKA